MLASFGREMRFPSVRPEERVQGVVLSHKLWLELCAALVLGLPSQSGRGSSCGVEVV